MQALTTEQFRDIDRYQYQGSLSKTRLLRHLVELSARELSWQGRDDANSLRDFWYNPTKAILEAAFPDWGDGVGSSDWNREFSKRLSGVVSDMVKDGDITYRDLNILDDSRDRRIATNSIEHDKILFVEKSAAFRKLKPLANVYDLTLVEGSGWQATALIEDLAHQLDPDVTHTFYVLGDFDPTGFGIVEDFVDRADRLGIDVDRDASRRIGIWPRQVDDDTLQSQKFTPGGSGSTYDDWMAKHAIDGKYGLEIEAVGGSLEEKAEALRQLVVDEISDEIDADERRFRDTQESAANVPYSAARSIVRTLTDDLEVALLEAAADVYTDIDGVESAEVTDWNEVRVGLNRDAVLNGGIDDTMVPQAYPKSRLHSGAVSGNEPYPNGKRKAKNEMQDRLKEQITDGDIDVAELIDV